MDKSKLLAILYEMGRRVGCPKSFFKPFKDGKAMPDRWWCLYEWTQAEEEAFAKWLRSYLKSKCHYTPYAIKREVPYFLLCWGWKYKGEVR